MKDVITQEVTIAADKARVYAAITEPEELTKWFPNAIEGGFEEGDAPLLDFGEHGKNRILIVNKKPYEYFAYRWVPGAVHFQGDVADVSNTLVEFFLEDVDGGVKVTVKESGFASLPEESRQDQFEQNTKGWSFMLGRLEKSLISA